MMDSDQDKISKGSNALVIHCDVQGEQNSRNAEMQLEEACGLAEAIHLNIVESLTVSVKKIRPATWIGKGKVEEITSTAREKNIELVIMNCQLSPIQQRNLEKELKCKVIDRTALILEIFGERAQTKEGTLQVELAALEYQKSRLVRSWTHLERQRGGVGFLGGPGESQIESDRRMIHDRITKIRKQLEKVKKTRSLHRKSRKQVPYPVIALVGYTNAGKSTLFNHLTGAKVMAKDLLFATLDPTMRIITLPSRQKAILSDTVGFISNLPTQLIAAFRATLEEVQEADIILHVRDISSPDSREQKQDVLDIMDTLLDNKTTTPIIEVLNKIDLTDISQEKFGEAIPISALTGKGCDELLQSIDILLAAGHKHFSVDIPASNGKFIAWIYEHAEMVESSQKDAILQLTGTMSDKNYSKYKKYLNRSKT